MVEIIVIISITVLLITSAIILKSEKGTVLNDRAVVAAVFNIFILLTLCFIIQYRVFVLELQNGSN